MGINATVTRTLEGTWLFTWTPGVPPYSIWLEGVEIATGLTTELFEEDASIFRDETPPLEILIAGDPPESRDFPPFVIIQWRGLQAADAYVVEQFINAAFVEVVNVMERATGYYDWMSDPLTDGATHLFRVIALNQVGTEGVPIPFTIDMARNPAPPSVAFDINSAGDLVVSAA